MFEGDYRHASPLAQYTKTKCFAQQLIGSSPSHDQAFLQIENSFEIIELKWHIWINGIPDYLLIEILNLRVIFF